jgi:hypothetical protein
MTVKNPIRDDMSVADFASSDFFRSWKFDDIAVKTPVFWDGQTIRLCCIHAGFEHLKPPCLLKKRNGEKNCII